MNYSSSVTAHLTALFVAGVVVVGVAAATQTRLFSDVATSLADSVPVFRAGFIEAFSGGPSRLSASVIAAPVQLVSDIAAGHHFPL